MCLDMSEYLTLTDKASAKYLASSSVNLFPVGTKFKICNIFKFKHRVILDEVGIQHLIVSTAVCC